MIAIVLMAVVGLFIVLAIVSGFVVLVTTLHIINVDTNSQWISFWGNYLGAITGGALSGGFAIYVMLNTIKNSRADQRKQRQKRILLCDEKDRYQDGKYNAN